MFNPKPSINKHDKALARAGAYDDIRKLKAIRDKYGLRAFVAFALGLIFFFPMHVLIFGGVPLPARISLVQSFFLDAAFTLKTGEIASWLQAYWGWYFSACLQGVTDPGAPGSIAIWKSAIILGCWIVGVSIPLTLMTIKSEGIEETPNIFGDTRWATERDIEEMSAEDLVGFDGKLFIVGKLKDKIIQMKETLSVLLLAPPGTGKTVAFIVPSTVMMDKSCQMLNDQKPELFHMTSGHRATLGPVYQLMWSAQDMPKGGWVTEEQAQLLSPELVEYDDDTGEPVQDDMGNIKTKPTFFPSWNPIGPKSIPSPGPRRDLYIERLAAILCPEPQGGEKFWASKARAGLNGLIHFLVAKTELGQDPNYPTIDEEGIPSIWHGREASFPMLVDWFTEAQNTVDEDSEDPMRQIFKTAIDQAKEMDAAYLARTGTLLMNRAIVELTALMGQPDKTRGSVLTTLDDALGPFKNEAVRQRTSNSSFSFNELRGIPKLEARKREEEKQKRKAELGEIYHPRYKDDEWDPITIYISVNAEDAKAFASITGIFVDSANAYLVAYGPGQIDDRGNQLGPYDFMFLLDETPTLPKLETVISGPAVGRSKRVSYAIVGQDFAQIETRYSKAEVETLKSTTAIKVVLSQNNETAAKAISSMAGSMTYKKASYAKKEFGDPITKFLDLKKEIISSEHWEKREFLSPSFIMAMPRGKHIVLVQNFMNRPLLSDTPRFFTEPEIGKRVYNLRTGTGPRPALPMPASEIEGAAQQREIDNQVIQDAANVNAAMENPEVVILTSPQNLAVLSFDFDTEQPLLEPGEDWAIVRVCLTKDMRFFEPPPADEIEITSDASRLAELVKDRKVYHFDSDDLMQINAALEAAGAKPVPAALATEIKSAMLEMDQEKEGDFFTIGYYGTPRLNRPLDLGELSLPFAAHWMCELVNTVHGCNYEFELMLPNGKNAA